MIRLTHAAAACVLALSLAAPALACMPPEAMDFSKHPAEVYTGERKAVDFDSHPMAAALNESDRARVRKAVEAGPNFAGAYRIVYAPCGEKCAAILVVSLATGKILRLPVADNAFANFRANSKFIVVRAPGGQAVRFFVFDGREFKPTESQSES